MNLVSFNNVYDSLRLNSYQASWYETHNNNLLAYLYYRENTTNSPIDYIVGSWAQYLQYCILLHNSFISFI